ncbi:MCE family protein [Nocardioides mesophilus]|uniref:MCE family protein n=1 Tax=Nocardioides mesophilus TaxID=433659 RepID=A0A7G9R6Z1_9ACTN|nr:MCE family protein [Nocardioides mesophilus]QNN51366.1 MCE family protein [Nocardioides mesophilus]
MSRRTCSRSLRSRVARLVTLVAVGAVALTGCDFSVYDVPLPGGADLGDDPYSVTVQFRDVLDLVPQSAVKVDDVTVGRVDSIDLDGYTAEVTVLLRGDVELPDNAVAEIRQTSLLGEKFVSLKVPPSGATPELLGDGDRIPLSRSGRNPEVEEVLGAMSLLLNGGGVAQLKTISVELNKALEGRETNVRGVLDQLDTFMGQLDQNKDSIVQAIESLNRLSKSLNRQKGAITTALDELPQALASIDRQRDDLVKMLRALSELSAVGTRVIRDSKEATIDSLEALAPTLTKLAEAGDALPKALQVFLTYPFVDAVVGKNPAQARNLHMGDYTNLAIQLDVKLTGQDANPIPDPVDLCTQTPLDPLCQEAGPVTETVSQVVKCIQSGDLASKACKKVTLKQLRKTCKKDKYKNTAVCRIVNQLPDTGEDGPIGGIPIPIPDLPLLGGGTGGTGGTGGDGTGGDVGGGLFRTMFGPAPERRSTAPDYDSELAPLLVWGMVPR